MMWWHKDTSDLEKRIGALEKRVRELNNEVFRVDSDLKRNVIEIKESLSFEVKNLCLRINMQERIVRDDFEQSIQGLSSMFNKRLENLGDKRGIVTDLLKKIARLEDANS